MRIFFARLSRKNIAFHEHDRTVRTSGFYIKKVYWLVTRLFAWHPAVVQFHVCLARSPCDNRGACGQLPARVSAVLPCVCFQICGCCCGSHGCKRGTASSLVLVFSAAGGTPLLGHFSTHVVCVNVHCCCVCSPNRTRPTRSLCEVICPLILVAILSFAFTLVEVCVPIDLVMRWIASVLTLIPPPPPSRAVRSGCIRWYMQTSHNPAEGFWTKPATISQPFAALRAYAVGRGQKIAMAPAGQELDDFLARMDDVFPAVQLDAVFNASLLPVAPPTWVVPKFRCAAASSRGDGSSLRRCRLLKVMVALYCGCYSDTVMTFASEAAMEAYIRQVTYPDECATLLASVVDGGLSVACVCVCAVRPG